MICHQEISDANHGLAHTRCSRAQLVRRKSCPDRCDLAISSKTGVELKRINCGPMRSACIYPGIDSRDHRSPSHGRAWRGRGEDAAVPCYAPAMPPPLLLLQDISLSFGTSPILAGAGLAVAPGDRLCLVGRNGSGKSTLLRIAAGLMQPDAGRRFAQPGATIRYLPQEPDLSGFPTHARLRRGRPGRRRRRGPAPRSLSAGAARPDR